MNNSICSHWGLPDPQSNSPNCGTYATGNMSTILKYCCKNGPIANYSDGGAPSYCFQYCNITDPGLNYQSVQQCIFDQASLGNSTGLDHGLQVDCGPGKNTATSNAPRAGVKLTWILLGSALIGALMAGDMAV